MNLVLFTHPAYLGLQSQFRLVQMLAEGYAARGHRVEVRRPPARLQAAFRERFPHRGWWKWAGYVDQYLLYPRQLRPLLARDPADTLYVFCDQALGPWLPLVQHRPHVVHCLDLLALRSALGLIPENPTGWTGRVYQRYIRAGYREGRHFISISEKTRSDLHEHGGVRPWTSAVVPLGLNHAYSRLPTAVARQRLHEHGLDAPSAGLLLHVGGGQWYKNPQGVLALYAAYAAQRAAASAPALPLWLVSPPPTPALQAAVDAVAAPGAVRFLSGVDNPLLQALYSLADALLFPSLAEGFGWPIAEAMACGCPVVTTGEAPMTEVGGPHAHYLPRLASAADLPAWAERGALRLRQVLDRPRAQREDEAQQAIAWTRRFDTGRAIEQHVDLYARVLADEARSAPSLQQGLAP